MTVNPLESWISLEIGLPRKTVLARNALRRWQKNRLLKTIELVRNNSPWYRKHLDGIEIPRTAHLPDLLRGLPFTASSDIRNHGQEMLCCSQSDIRRVVTLQSSGTSAAPKRLFFTTEDLEKTSAFFHYGMRLVTAPNTRILVLLPDALENDVGSLLMQSLNTAGFSARTLWPADEPEVLAKAIVQFRADCLIGLPQHILALARMPHLPAGAARCVKNVLLCSDYAATCVRHAIAENLDCTVHRHYGSTESGLGGAVECSQGAGCHIRENDLLVEVVDPVTGIPLPEDKEGELVITTLTRTGMPLLRYRTGDLGRLTSRRCACGSILARIERLEGRLNNRVRLPGGGWLWLSELDRSLLKIPALMAYQAELTHAPILNRRQTVLVITLVSNGGASQKLYETVRGALSEIPALASEVLRDDFAVIFKTARKLKSRPHTHKRQIQDNRNRLHGSAYAKTA
ncbi:MAG: AMP-binding protein [Desulfobacteraceae bacterium]|nr:AMP-binding protein [Desulfobacteraceae bacterium]